MVINRDNKKGSSDNDPGHLDVPGSYNDNPSVQDNAITLRENALIDDKTTLLIREKLVSAREDAANFRENAASLREDAIYHREETVLQLEDAADLPECKAPLSEQDAQSAESMLAASDDHLKLLQQANAHLVIASIEAHKMAEQVQMAKDQLAHLAHHDVLTALPNRILLLDRMNSAIELAARQGWQLALMFMDLDRFKYVNDSLGHAVGDQLLQSVAQCLLDSARHSDTISRQGGDEFVVLLPFIERAEEAALCAQKIIVALDLPHHIDGHDLHISVSIGISIFPKDGQDAESLIKNADTAMYCAKESGRNKYKFFEPEMNIRAVRRHSMEASLRRALDRHEFVLYYQPKIDLNSGVIVGVEVLIRWQHPERGQILPTQFVSIAEDCGLILPIGRWVLREACLQAQAWRQAGLPPISIAVNTSALEFHAENFLQNIRDTLQEACLEPHYLELELTESVLMRDAEFTNTVLHELSDLGVTLAIDDFGTGYSSLSYLRQFPIDTLKIDQSFVNRIINSPDDASIVSAVISLGKSLKLRVIAEGVETSEQLAFLQAQQCDEVQGYYLGRPMVAEALASYLRTGVIPLS